MSSLLQIALVAFVVNGILYRAGYFSLGTEEKKPSGLPDLSVYTSFVYLILIQTIGMQFIASKLWKLNPSRETMIVLIQLTYAIILLGGLILIAYFSKARLSMISKSFSIKDFGFGALTLVIAYPMVSTADGVINYILQSVFQTEGPGQMVIRVIESVRDAPISYAIVITTAVFFAPIIEEYLFRGLLQTFLRKRFGPRASILMSATVFAFFHFMPAQGVSNISLLATIFVLALYLGFCYEKRQSLFASIAMHMTFNAVGVLQVHFA